MFVRDVVRIVVVGIEIGVELGGGLSSSIPLPNEKFPSFKSPKPEEFWAKSEAAEFPKYISPYNVLQVNFFICTNCGSAESPSYRCNCYEQK